MHAHTATDHQNKNADYVWNLKEVSISVLAHCSRLTSASSEQSLQAQHLQIENTGKKTSGGKGWEYREGNETVLSASQQLGFLEQVVSTSNFAL